ncbi:MAG: hypothetical protein M1822_009074 [Bathelium mastoideum]|nr:MAG: hypothetical protein M1822_009074 [Bathelium mastoideum]
MASQYSVQQVLAFDDPTLIQFLVDNRKGTDTFDISDIIDWDDVPDALREELRKRILAVGSQAKAPRTLDPSQLAAKLAGLAKEAEAKSQPPTVRSPTLSPDPNVAKEHQIRCYHELIRDGGKLVCSPETLDRIYEDPAAYREIWHPWQGDVGVSSPEGLGVFSRPLARWKEFRRWQRHNRRLITATEESFAAFREEEIRYNESAGLSQMTRHPQFEDIMRKRWPEVRDGTFAEYAAAAQRRLASHDFSQPFQLLEDPDRQDERVTWIEYLEFECWWLDQYAKSVARHEQTQSNNHDRGAQVRIERAKKKHSKQQLRVQWVLDKMPLAEEALESTAPPPATESREIGKRRRRGDDQVVEVVVGQVAKRQRQGKQSDTQKVAERKVLASRLLLRLETPVAQTRMKTKDGTRRSARIAKKSRN